LFSEEKISSLEKLPVFLTKYEIIVRHDVYLTKDHFYTQGQTIHRVLKP